MLTASGKEIYKINLQQGRDVYQIITEIEVAGIVETLVGCGNPPVAARKAQGKAGIDIVAVKDTRGKAGIMKNFFGIDVAQIKGSPQTDTYLGTLRLQANRAGEQTAHQQKRKSNSKSTHDFILAKTGKYTENRRKKHEMAYL